MGKPNSQDWAYYGLQFKELKTRLKELEQKVRQQDMQLDYLMKEVYGGEAEVDDDERISCWHLKY